VPVQKPVSTSLVEAVEGTEKVGTVGSGHMQVNHGGIDAYMTEQVFNGHNVHPKLKKMGGITVAKGMEGDSFLEFALLYGLP
jgi:hypothetical protein